MKNAHSYYKRPKSTFRFGAKIKTALVVVFLLIIFIYGVKWFRTPKEEAPAVVEYPDITEIATLEHTESSLADNPTADLSAVDSSGAHGTATRDIEDDKFHHVVKASLPGINEEYFYFEGWLVRPVPFDYFSTGDMVHNEDGQWVLEWFGEENTDYSAYIDVVITRETIGGSPDPEVHILEGSFE